MTIQEQRDRLAELLGWTSAEGVGIQWKRQEPDAEYGHIWAVRTCHPVDGTLDGLAAVWEERCKGWAWLRLGKAAGAPIWTAEEKEWRPLAVGKERSRVIVPDTGNEYADRLALTIRVLEASSHPARPA